MDSSGYLTWAVRAGKCRSSRGLPKKSRKGSCPAPRRSEFEKCQTAPPLPAGVVRRTNPTPLQQACYIVRDAFGMVSHRAGLRASQGRRAHQPSP